MYRKAIWSGVVIAIIGTAALVRWLDVPARPTPNRLADLPQFRGGTLVIAGGGVLPDEVRRTFIDLAGGPDAKLVVIPAYMPTAQQVERLQTRWAAFQPAEVRVCFASSRAEAESAAFVASVAAATGVWLSGGEQSLLAKLYVGTPVEAALQNLVARGGVVGGSSAGAAIMSKCMIEQGREQAQLGVGFDLLPDAVIDQHFLRRNRLQRLAGVLRDRPQLLGFGIDEGTALVVQPEKGNLAVLGQSYALAIISTADNLPPRYEIMKRGDQITMTGLRSGQMQMSSPLDLDALLDE